MSSVNKGEIEISFSSDISYLELLQDVSDNISRLIGLDQDSRYWVGLSLRESVTNAIQHGNKYDSSKMVGVRFKIHPDRLIITVRDEGTGMEEDDLPDPLNPDNLLKPSGRGIFFVRSFMDDVRFERRAEGGHEVIMEMRLNHKNQGEEHDN